MMASLLGAMSITTENTIQNSNENSRYDDVFVFYRPLLNKYNVMYCE